MSDYVLSPEAEEDLGDLALLGTGSRCLDGGPHPVFFYPVYEYLIVYRKSVPLEVAAIIHGKRDVQRLLKDRSL